MWGWIWWLWTPSYTVKEPIKLVGEPYFAGQPDTVIVHPRPSGDGIWFKHGDMLTPLKVGTLHAHTELTARFLQVEGVTNSRTWCVVEHTVAALFGALWADASAVIEVTSSEKAMWSWNIVSWLKRGVWKVFSWEIFSWRERLYVPVLWPGIKEPFDALYAARTPVVSRSWFSADYVGLRRHTDRYVWVWNAYLIECDNTSVTYTEEDPQIWGKRVMRFSISDNDASQMTVHSSAQPDVSLVAQLQPQSYSAWYTPEFLIDHPELLQARALGRLENPTVYRLFSVLQPVFDFQGISERTYFMATPHDKTAKNLIDKMQPAFQEWQNEWFAHTVLDMIAETWIIPRAFSARSLGLNVDVRNSNHAFRMRAISRLVERNYFGPRIPQSDPTV